MIHYAPLKQLEGPAYLAEDLAKTTIDVTCGNGDVFTFKIPGPRDYARVGSRAHELRRQDSPSTGGAEYGLDPFSQDLYRGFALLEILLVKADAKDNWPYTNDANGKPVIDCAKFPPKAIQIIPEVTRGFETALLTFLS